MNTTHRDSLDLESLAPATVHHLWLSLGTDALGQAVELPILIARGAKPGPVFGITAALHGNEINGIPVLQRLVGELDVSRLRGTVVGVVVANVPGFLGHRRTFLGGWDLNHLFPGKPNGHSGQVYVHRMMDRIIRHLDFLVDLHTASLGRVNSLYVRADMSSPETNRLARLQRPQLIVNNPPHDGTLRGAAAALGIPAITLEIGNPQRFQKDFIRRSVRGLRRVLMDQGMIRKRPLKEGQPPILCDRSSWLYTDAGGLLEIHPALLDHVREGETVATLRDPFGNITATWTAPHDGVVIGKSVNPVAETGARILHLGVLSPDSPTPEIQQEEL
ncbi:MAG: succinylglutamate desuccinylase/aspartoacylase family protein [Myxococcota bacterium]|nr:succinylglutamate desuccinylase/aspartoacylase family protein [Myxococcota bacterium]